MIFKDSNGNKFFLLKEDKNTYIINGILIEKKVVLPYPQGDGSYSKKYTWWRACKTAIASWNEICSGFKLKYILSELYERSLITPVSK